MTVSAGLYGRKMWMIKR